MKEYVVFFLAGLLLFFLLSSTPLVLCQDAQLFQEGVTQYYAENYEEAIEIFQKILTKDPRSSQVAFFLGMSYKQISDFQNAMQPLHDAVTLNPPVNDAVVELAEVLYRLDKPEEAKKWLALSEKNNTFPAKTAYLKGMILAKEGKYTEAIGEFEKSKNVDASYSQMADYQIGLAHVADRNYAKARERLQAVVTQDPLSDLASFARRYQDIVEERRFLERPLRITIGIMGQYDTNMLQEPNPSTGVSDMGDGRSFAMMNSLRIDYVPTFSGPWLFNASYALGNTLYEKNSTTHDILANSFFIAPGYNFGRFAVNLSTRYTHSLKRDSSYKNYYETYAVGPLFRFLMSQNHILEFYGAYTNDHYFEDSLYPEENQNAIGFDSYIGWIWVFQNGGMMNLKYGYSDKKADGDNWSNNGHRFTANFMVPIRKTIRIQLGGEAFLQDYRNVHTDYDIKRQDKTYSAMAGLVWDVHKNVALNALYNYTKAVSNIDLYDYERHLYTVGVELKF